MENQLHVRKSAVGLITALACFVLAVVFVLSALIVNSPPPRTARESTLGKARREALEEKYFQDLAQRLLIAGGLVLIGVIATAVSFGVKKEEAPPALVDEVAPELDPYS
jgi:uncharacterized membrane protein YphA (DoxX/SURF4 family)